MKKYFIGFLLMFFTGNIFSQEVNYSCCIKNITKKDPSTIEFDVYIEWIGSTNQKFTSFQGGIDFNYVALANGGKITGAFKAGSADRLLPPNQQKPNWDINQDSKQIRLKAVIAADSNAVAIPLAPGLKLGTFVMTNTVPFKKSVNPEFRWSFKTGSKSTTKTQVSAYLNDELTPKNITKPEAHCVKKN